MNDPTQQSLAAALADRYTLERELGRGGMATVYLARDIRHARQVAIKVLHPELAAVLGAERFLSEIKTTANLQHPNILPLFDSGSADGQLFYVMPFVQGETLRARLERETQLPIADAVQLAREVASALQYAHEHGVIHRDIKPENILLQGSAGDQHALVADFGIALAVQQAGGQRMTQTGLSLGTPQYMSPEQAMGEKAVDARADIYALGAMTYEMLAGEPPFSGPTAQAIIARVLTSEAPSLGSLRKAVPPNIAEAVHHALEKLPADRFTDARSYAAALLDTSPRPTSTHMAMAPAPPRGRWRDPVFVALTGVAVVAAATAAFFASRGTGVEASRVTAAVLPLEIRTPTNLPFNEVGPPITIAPDGSFIVYVGADPDQPGATALWRRRLDGLSATVILGTRNAHYPRVSADGRSVYFIARAEDGVRNLSRVVPIEGGASREVRGPGGRMNLMRDGTIAIFDSVAVSVSLVAPSTRADTASLVRASGGFERSLSPDQTRITGLVGDSILVYRVGEPGPAVLGLGRSPRFLDASTIVFSALDGPLMVGRLNAEATEFVAPPIALTENVSMTPSGQPIFDIGSDGTLIYAAGGGDGNASRMVRVTREGREERLRDDENRPYQSVAISPDGRRVATYLGRAGGGSGDVWVHDLESGTRLPITTDGHSFRAVWSGDGRRVAYTRGRPGLAGGGETVMQRSAAADAPEDSVPGPWNSGGTISEFQWTADGRAHAIRANLRTPGYGRDVLVRAAPGAPLRLFAADSAVQERAPRISPDGRWLAFASDRSTRDEIYVDAFPNGGARLQVSVDGGREPTWSRDGNTIFYRDLEGWMVAASVSRGAGITVTKRERLFDANAYLANQFVVMYDVGPDGRFVMLKREAEAARTDITIVRNWVPQAIARLEESLRNRRAP